MPQADCLTQVSDFLFKPCYERRKPCGKRTTNLIYKSPKGMRRLWFSVYTLSYFYIDKGEEMYVVLSVTEFYELQRQVRDLAGY